MAFSRFLSSSYRSFKAFIRRRPIVTTAVSYFAISYAARSLIRRFNTDEQNANADDHLRPFRATDVFYPGRMLGRVMFSMIDRHVNMRETEEAVVLRYCVLSDVKKEDVKVFLDRNILKIEDTFPNRNRFSGTLDLAGKNFDGVVMPGSRIPGVVLELWSSDSFEHTPSSSTVGKYKEASCGLAFVEHNGQTYAPSLPSEMEHNGQTYAPSLPSEILITKIFALFPTITISNTRSWKRVSKGWKFAASHHDYARMQRDRATLGLLFIDSEERDYQGLSNYFLENINLNPNQLLPVYGTPWIDAHTRYKISNSTGGYLGLYNGSARDPVIVCNPIIGEYCRVPGNELNANRVVVALGSHQDRFKLLRFSFGDFIFELDPAVISLFTLGSQNWQVVGVGHNFVYVKPHPVSIDGGIYFLATLETDLPNQLRVVRFNLQTDDFTYLDLPNDPNHPVASFTRDHTSIGIIDGRLYILKCNWQGGGGGHAFRHRVDVLVASNLKVWVYENGAWNVFIHNVTIPTAHKCPLLFNSPEREGSYIIYAQHTNRIVVYEGEGVPLQRYFLQGDRNRIFTAIQHTPNLLSMNDSMTLDNPIEIRRCEKGIADEVMLVRAH